MRSSNNGLVSLLRVTLEGRRLRPKERVFTTERWTIGGRLGLAFGETMKKSRYCLSVVEGSVPRAVRCVIGVTWPLGSASCRDDTGNEGISPVTGCQQ